MKTKKMDQMIVIYKLVPMCEAMLSPDNKRATTADVLDAKYAGGTNQVEVEATETSKGRFWIIKNYL